MNLTQPQLEQLRLLRDMGAVSEQKAVDRRTCDGGHGRADRLNMTMIGVALFPKGLVNRVEKPAQYGEPKRRLYYLSAHGLTALEQAGR